MLGYYCNDVVNRAYHRCLRLIYPFSMLGEGFSEGQEREERREERRVKKGKKEFKFQPLAGDLNPGGGEERQL